MFTPFGMALTQHQLVKHLGISRGTLHRVLTNSPLVKSSTKERILRELESLNYTPNAVARGLKMRRTQTIGIIGPSSIKMANIKKINALYKAATDKGYHIILGYSDGSPEADENCIRDLSSRMVDGMIVLGRGMVDNIPQYRSVIESGIPFLSLYPIPGLKSDCVYVDTKKAFCDLTLYLAGLGHKDIALLLDGAVSQYTRNREAGFRQGMKKAGLAVREEWVVRWLAEKAEPGVELSDYDLGFRVAVRVLASSPRPSALVCFSDEFAIGALRAAEAAGIAVPGELALVGYDDNEAAPYAGVPLTTMHQPVERLASEAIELLVERIEGRGPEKPARHPIEAKLVIRKSSGDRVRTA